jgi:hypothetical protein
MLDKAFKLVLLKCPAFWDVTLCRFVVIDVQRACSTFETSVTIYGWLDEWEDGMDICKDG